MSITTAANKASAASKASSATHADIDPFPSFSTALAKPNKLAMQTQHLLGDPKKNLFYRGLRVPSRTVWFSRRASQSIS
ncbi:hypothetical protein BC835DRAFT_1417419 [Cytidiella melzeri]|nr:hypothetical protein BC835DRAFT_1417419 [Cytidiella melzeri]